LPVNATSPSIVSALAVTGSNTAAQSASILIISVVSLEGSDAQPGTRFKPVDQPRCGVFIAVLGAGLFSSKTKKWRTIRAPSAASLIAERKVADQEDAILVLPCSDHRILKVLKKVSESVDIRYGQNVMDGWCPHDLRHTCLTNLAVAGVPLNGIKEYAGHA